MPSRFERLRPCFLFVLLKNTAFVTAAEGGWVRGAKYRSDKDLELER